MDAERRDGGPAEAEAAVATSKPGRVTFLAYKTLGDAMQAVPEPVAAAASWAVGMALTAARRESRAMYARHLRRVLGEDLSEREVRAWTRRAFVSYARYWMEGARLPAVPAAEVRARMVTPLGIEHLLEGMAAGRGVVMALPHVGSWEWGGAWLALEGMPMTTVGEPVEPRELYEYFASQREAMGLKLVELGAGTGTVLLKTLRAGGLVGLLCDRDIVGNGVEVEFFGEKTTFPTGPATLALRTGAYLLPTVVYSGPGRDHSAEIRPPIDVTRTKSLRADVARVTQELAYELEVFIRKAPQQWHLFQPNWPSDVPGGSGTREERGPRAGSA